MAGRREFLPGSMFRDFGTALTWVAADGWGTLPCWQIADSQNPETWLVGTYRVGGVVANPTSHTTVRAVRHTAVHDESSEALMRIEQANQSLRVEPGGGDAGVHMRRPRIPPRATAVEGRDPSPLSLQPKGHHFPGPGRGLLPLTPQNAAQLPTNPLVQFLKDALYSGKPEVGNPAQCRLV